MSEKKSGFWYEFKLFISKGNVMDMAVGVIMGTAFTAIVNSMVKDILMPFLSLIIGKINFTDLKIVIKPATETVKEVALTYGNFIQAIINFLLIALCVFIMVRQLNKIRAASDARKKQQEAQKPAAPVAPPAPPADVILLQEIRDLLKKQEGKK
jgi:large conductance mechanosensitive channel